MSSPELPSSRSPRPRIRKAHSYEYEYSGPRAGRAVASDAAVSAGGSHWYGDDGVLYYRGDDGAEFYCASDGAYYPRELLVDALAASSARTADDSAAHDRSTYYEYIARHSAELPAQQSSPHGSPTNGSGPAHAAHAQGTSAEAPVTHGAIPPRPTTPPTALPGSTTVAGAPELARGAGRADSSAASQGESGALRRRTGPLTFGAIAVIAVLALGIGLGFTFLGPDRGIQATDIESPGSSSTPGSPAPDDAGDDGDVPATAGEQLDAHVTAGTRVAEQRLTDQWVVQLSAKKPGLEANGRTWDEEAILEEFQENQGRHPEAVLLWSGDWSSFRLGDFWVTVLAEPYDSPDEALAMCTDMGLDRDNCFAKRLSTSEGPDGTTALND
ncbi:hypothetical protein BJEO58_01721 [Brevibacterium jeotgali]|uniref:Uncharacterized protein n=1 Tax=Brevibacterium jeotgali TaxID=1262550 RepID=A0A2H1L5E7_9MICO|nr:hypothetical protein [Brevibacterium jeotgali]SMY12127.1 hypothetical protein BJEO58_01721 [Brevibacterium jeotgali]